MSREQKPSVGRIVHYALDLGPNKGAARRADIVEVYDDGRVDLVVTAAISDIEPATLDGWCYAAGDTRMAARQFYVHAPPFDPDGAPGTWRWPPVV